jgi:hypothetical protein
MNNEQLRKVTAGDDGSTPEELGYFVLALYCYLCLEQNGL